MAPSDVLTLLVNTVEIDEQVEVHTEDQAQVRVFYPDNLHLRRRPSGTWLALWCTGQVSQWRHEASTPWAALAHVVDSRLRWGWGFQSDLKILRGLQAVVAQKLAEGAVS